MRHRKHDIIAIVEAVTALNQGEKQEAICNKWGISSSTLYRWHSLYSGMNIETIIWVERLRYDNAELKRKIKRLEYDIELLRAFLNQEAGDIDKRFNIVKRLLKDHGVSVSRACKLIGLSRTTYKQKRQVEEL